MLRFLARGQVAFEFVLLVGILFTALMVFTSFVRDNFSSAQSDTDFYKLKDLAISVKTEYLLAANLQDGYERQFFVPFTIDGLEYNFSNESTSLVVQSAGAEYSVSVPVYTGWIKKGNNVIRKTNGSIQVNP